MQVQPEDKNWQNHLLMVDGKFEDAAFKSQKLIEDPNIAKVDGLGIIWPANFEIAKSQKLQEDYPKL